MKWLVAYLGEVFAKESEKEFTRRQILRELDPNSGSVTPPPP